MENQFAEFGAKAQLLGLNQFAAEVHQNAVSHGWWEKEPSFGDIISLCHCELSEAMEEYRKGKPHIYYVVETIQNDGKIIPEMRTDCVGGSYGGEKPEGVAVELADCILRILDYCAAKGIDIEFVLRQKHEYNQSRPYKHGGKKL